MKEDLCKHCGQGPIIDGSLEGVTFVPESRSKKLLTTGIYGLSLSVCSACGYVADIRMNIDALAKRLRDK
jgi:hypothetical protein